MGISWQGKRIADNTEAHLLQAGEYSKMADGFWNIRPPANAQGKSYHGRINPAIHKVEEHDDGTITVTPSIKQEWGDGEELWHGYLTRGVWTLS